MNPFQATARLFAALFRRRPIVVVNHYHKRMTDLQKRQDLKHAQMARQIGFPWKDRLNG